MTAVLPFVAMALPLVGRRWLLFPVGLSLLALAGAAFSPDPGAALATSATQIGWAAALALGLARPESAQFCALVTAAGAAAALPGVFVDDGTFGNPDYLAGFVALSTPAAVATLVRGGSTARALAALALVIDAAALVRANSLGAFLAVGVAGLAALFVRASRAQRIGLVAAGVGGVLLACWSTEVQSHVAGRFHLWETTARVVRHTFPWGTGPGLLHGPFLEAQGPGPWTNAYHAHNELLHVLAEQGLAGMLLLAIPVVTVLLRPTRGAAWPTVCAAVVICSVSLPLYEPATAALIWLALGGALADASGRGEPSAAPTPLPVPARRLGVALATLSAVAGTLELVSDRLLFDGARRGATDVLDLSAALALRPAFALQQAAGVLAETDPQGCLERAADAVRRDPSPNGWALVGRCAALQDDVPAAIDAYQTAARLHPQLYAAHFNLAILHGWQGDRATARRHAIRARSLRPSDPRNVELPP